MLTMPALQEDVINVSLLTLMAPPAPLPCLKSVMLTRLAVFCEKVDEVMLRTLKLAA